MKLLIWEPYESENIKLKGFRVINPHRTAQILCLAHKLINYIINNYIFNAADTKRVSCPSCVNQYGRAFFVGAES